MKKILRVMLAVLCLALTIAVTWWMCRIEESPESSLLMRCEIIFGWLGTWIIFFMSCGAILKPDDKLEESAISMTERIWEENWPIFRSTLVFVGRLLICFNVMTIPFFIVEVLFEPSIVVWYAVLGVLFLFMFIGQKLSLFDGLNAKLSQRIREGCGVLGWLFRPLVQAVSDTRT